MWFSVLAGIAIGASTLYALYPWLYDDIIYLYYLIPALFKCIIAMKKKSLIIDIFEGVVKKFRKNTYIIFEDEKYTYGEVDDNSNRFARFLQSQGVVRGDVVALMAFNCPDMVWWFMGCQKIGVQTAMINTNLRHKSLRHCIEIAEAKILIIETDLLDAFHTAEEDETLDIKLFVSGPPNADVLAKFPANRLCSLSLEPFNQSPIDASIRDGIRMADCMGHIFTSGTTGLPKAAIVSQQKALFVNVGGRSVHGFTPGDVTYITLPMYHASALFTAISQAGGTVALAKKFSATRFWDDCRKYKATHILYIGELCRYLLAKAEKANDKDHSVRVAMGNGLRPEIWAKFKARFGIPVIREVYAATEGLGFFVNFNNKDGCVGRLSPLIKKILPCQLLDFDADREEVRRGSDGWCRIVGPGETGLMVWKVTAAMKFDGYKGNKKNSEKKLLRNVFGKGDCYYNSGDLLRTDDRYFVMFQDRVGDTFRWKGENVATTEVASVIAAVDDVIDVCVYGVNIAGCEGRVGMAAIVLRSDEISNQDVLEEIFAVCQKQLPSYARPAFLRFMKKLAITGTFKHSKREMKEQGFNPDELKESLFVMDVNNNRYNPLTSDVYGQILNGDYKL